LLVQQRGRRAQERLRDHELPVVLCARARRREALGDFTLSHRGDCSRGC
jgi:hypothetical protein